MTDYERIKREFDLSMLERLAQTVRQMPSIEDIWPVGSIYMSINSTDPGALFGGVWERIEGRFLLGASSKYAAGTIGGEADHQLTVAEMPAHAHSISYGIATNHPGMATTVMSNGDYSSYIAQSAGGDKAHNNMPPYLSVFVWKRVK